MMGDDYRAVEASQGDGTYPKLLERLAPHILEDAHRTITQELQRIKELDGKARIHEIHSIIRYWSQAQANRIARIDDSHFDFPTHHGKPLAAFENTSLELFRASKYSRKELESGDFEPSILADRLIRACIEYDKNVTLPLTTQIADQLKDEFTGANFLFLGRDFTSVYLYIHASEVLPKENIFLANVSRNVRNACIADTTDGKLYELRSALEQCGLSTAVALSEALVVVDTSMKGKIPAIIFQALSLGMTDEEAYRFLTNCTIRYIRSGRHRGRPFHEIAENIGIRNGRKLNREDRNQLLEKINHIEEFDRLHYPPQVGAFIHRRHKIFEWRPKTIQVATGTRWNSIDSFASFTTEAPQFPSDRIMCTLGLMLDVYIQKAGRRTQYALEDEEPVKAFDNWYAAIGKPWKNVNDIEGELNHRRDGGDVSDELTIAKAELDEALPFGIPLLRAWQNEGPKKTRATIVETKIEELPYELHFDKKPVYRLRDIIGEGNSILAYLTEQSTVMKVAKNPEHARKNIMLAWAESYVAEAGVDLAKVLRVGPDGHYLEQEHIPGANLEERFAEEFEKDPLSLPPEIRKQIKEVHHKARMLITGKGIYLDVKAANFQLRENGQITMVDYTPRVNKTHFRYFDREDGTALTMSEFLTLFFCHDRSKRWERT